MKKTLVRKRAPSMETLLSEYRFDYRKSKPNRFATKMREGTIAVVLELDVAAAIRSSGKTGGSIAGVSAAATRCRVSTICSIISMCRGHRSFGGAVPDYSAGFSLPMPDAETSISEEPGARKGHARICAGEARGNWPSYRDAGPEISDADR